MGDVEFLTRYPGRPLTRAGIREQYAVNLVTLNK